ncbi:15938_t:CDS:2 [Funneliformis geosporum]|nr:15938_t:CDS:2 [Funneliformis geosporum]
MEYTDGGALRNYSKEDFDKLSWGNKYNLAFQLACAVSCLHDEGIVHRDLHSGKLLIHLGGIKLADFGLSKRIEAATYQAKVFGGVIPYINPKTVKWKSTFHVKDEMYDISLAIEIAQGLRESIVPGTSEDYVKLYTDCWDNEPDNRPSMNIVVDELNAIIAKTNIDDYGQLKNNESKLQLDEQLIYLNSSKRSTWSSNGIVKDLSISLSSVIDANGAAFFNNLM